LQKPASNPLDWAARTTRVVVEEAAALSENGVFRVGKALGALVDESRSQTSDLLAVLPKIEGGNHGDQDSIREAIERQTATVTAFIRELLSRADGQNQLAEQAAQLSKSIATLARDVSGIAMNARLLSLNATIECNRLGESGRAMTVVASEIRQVSGSVGKANSDIADLAAQLSALLPNVARLSRELGETSGKFQEAFQRSQSSTQASFSELMALVKETVGRSQARAERMTIEAQGALSALNFQDPMVQSLRELASRVEDQAERAARGQLHEEVHQELDAPQGESTEG
jgi:methyl-accepting chemotaxis protein